MGFRQADNEKRGGYARIWAVEDKGGYSTAKISTRKKRKGSDNEYDTDFQDGFVRLIGEAHKKAQELNVTEKGVPIQITSCEVTTPYDAEKKKGYVNYAIFSFDIPDGKDSSNVSSAKPSKAKKNVFVVDESDDELPF